MLLSGMVRADMKQSLSNIDEVDLFGGILDLFIYGDDISGVLGEQDRWINKA